MSASVKTPRRLRAKYAADAALQAGYAAQDSTLFERSELAEAAFAAVAAARAASHDSAGVLMAIYGARALQLYGVNKRQTLILILGVLYVEDS